MGGRQAGHALHAERGRALPEEGIKGTEVRNSLPYFVTACSSRPYKNPVYYQESHCTAS